MLIYLLITTFNGLRFVLPTHHIFYPRSKSEILPFVPGNGSQIEVHIYNNLNRSVLMPNKYMNCPTSCEVGHRLFDESAWLPTAPRHAPIVD
jgi:hypothetical protein